MDLPLTVEATNPYLRPSVKADLGDAVTLKVEKSSLSEVLGFVTQATLVLGALGAGKTTLLLEYGRDLLAVARQDIRAPVPFLFELHRWPKSNKSFETWLAAEVARVLGPRGVTDETARQWFQEGAIAILLDGLDEVPADRPDSSACGLRSDG